MNKPVLFFKPAALALSVLLFLAAAGCGGGPSDMPSYVSITITGIVSSDLPTQMSERDKERNFSLSLIKEPPGSLPGSLTIQYNPPGLMTTVLKGSAVAAEGFVGLLPVSRVYPGPCSLTFSVLEDLIEPAQSYVLILGASPDQSKRVDSPGRMYITATAPDSTGRTAKTGAQLKGGSIPWTEFQTNGNTGYTARGIIEDFYYP
ncbi:MAG: hypothetical protein LBG84_03630 [Treponema sp.]|nr:hypothetical protein [Treponema sp.]